jgi:hypothetical protein
MFFRHDAARRTAARCRLDRISAQHRRVAAGLSDERVNASRRRVAPAGRPLVATTVGALPGLHEPVQSYLRHVERVAHNAKDVISPGVENVEFRRRTYESVK